MAVLKLTLYLKIDNKYTKKIDALVANSWAEALLDYQNDWS